MLFMPPRVEGVVQRLDFQFFQHDPANS